MAKITQKTLKTEDRYTQELVGAKEVDTTAAAGAILEQLQTAYRPQDRVGFVIQRIEYAIHNTDNWNGLFTSSGDRLLFGLCFIGYMPQAYGFNLDEDGLIDYNSIEEIAIGTPNTGILFKDPIIKDFSKFKGGGKLVHPSHIYIWIGSPDTLGTAVYLNYRITYFSVALTENDYRELWEARTMIQGISG